MRIIISGGGTGGHIYPALAIASGIKKRLPGTRILYVGSYQGMESRIVPQQGWDYQGIDISGINRSSMLKASRSLVKFPRSFFQGWDIAKNFKPDIIVGTGGYASFPVVLAGTFIPCRTVIHEQNAVPGLANRTLAKRVDQVLLTFEEAARYMPTNKVRVTGLPVRREILEVSPEKARRRLGLKTGLFTLLAFGGSQGAATINRAMLEVVERLVGKELQIIWITGPQHYNELKESVEQRRLSEPQGGNLLMIPYMDNMEDALAVADLAVCRAGAGTLSELAILGLPAILVPYPYAAENHQEKNARALEKKNAAAMVIDEFLDGDTLVKKIQALHDQPEVLGNIADNIRKEARPTALEDILDAILA